MILSFLNAMGGWRCDMLSTFLFYRRCSSYGARSGDLRRIWVNKNGFKIFTDNVRNLANPLSLNKEHSTSFSNSHYCATEGLLRCNFPVNFNLLYRSQSWKLIAILLPKGSGKPLAPDPENHCITNNWTCDILRTGNTWQWRLPFYKDNPILLHYSILSFIVPTWILQDLWCHKVQSTTITMIRSFNFF